MYRGVRTRTCILKMGLKRTLRVLKKVLEVDVVSDYPHLVADIKKEIRSIEIKLSYGTIK